MQLTTCWLYLIAVMLDSCFYLLVILLFTLRYLATNCICVPCTSNILVLGNCFVSEREICNVLYCWIWRFASDVGQLPWTHMVVVKEINIWIPDTTKRCLLDNRFVLVKEICKSITLVELKILLCWPLVTIILRKSNPFWDGFILLIILSN